MITIIMTSNAAPPPAAQPSITNGTFSAPEKQS